MIRINKNQSGFTLIETFVAITILLISILGPLGLFANYFKDVDYVKRQTTATFLAQEGVELLMANREYYLRQGSENGFDGMVDCFSGWCLIRPTTPVKLDKGLSPFCTDESHCQPLSFNPNNLDGKYFTYEDTTLGNGPVVSPYIRAVKLEVIESDPLSGKPILVKAKVNVHWLTRGGQAKDTPVETYLYDQIF